MQASLPHGRSSTCAPSKLAAARKARGRVVPGGFGGPTCAPEPLTAPLPAHSLPNIPEKFFTPNSPTLCPHSPEPSQLRPTCIFIAERCLKR